MGKVLKYSPLFSPIITIVIAVGPLFLAFFEIGARQKAEVRAETAEKAHLAVIRIRIISRATAKRCGR
jgi:hypothetical protein